ncbi:uncharacterized protein LOC116661181 isoform X1 [Camelus ferus]|uniref:Uncharacterized protein LOC116661181 isoform X1 n=1 Tax=Camelus ferus TaxID=419612 RepID=A0A8B8SGK9_CAMFR|nr:uncharacterized protein LOC116661181 isoform X1 [Camelus ferus]
MREPGAMSAAWTVSGKLDSWLVGSGLEQHCPLMVSSETCDYQEPVESSTTVTSIQAEALLVRPPSRRQRTCGPRPSLNAFPVMPKVLTVSLRKKLRQQERSKKPQVLPIAALRDLHLPGKPSSPVASGGHGAEKPGWSWTVPLPACLGLALLLFPCPCFAQMPGWLRGLLPVFLGLWAGVAAGSCLLKEAIPVFRRHLPYPQHPALLTSFPSRCPRLPRRCSGPQSQNLGPGGALTWIPAQGS